MGKRAREERRFLEKLTEELATIKPTSPSYVILHAELRRHQGLPPVMPYCELTNPQEAIRHAVLDYIIRDIFWEIEEERAVAEGRPALEPIPLPPAPQPAPSPPRGSWGTKLAIGILRATYNR